MHKNTVEDMQGRTVWVNPEKIVYMTEVEIKGEQHVVIAFDDKADELWVKGSIQAVMNHLP